MMPVAVNRWLGIRRRATVRRGDGTTETRWLDEWREEGAYVLLGDPGAGKSWSFETEAKAIGENVISARMIQADIEPLVVSPRTVFIDALDEVRGGVTSGADALGVVARWLNRSGSPRFRIACREADWRGEADRQLIERVAPSGQVTTLHLESLAAEDILDVLRQHTDAVSSPEKFLEEAERHGVVDLLGNPLMLNLMIDAVAADGGNWPETRFAVYSGACRHLADETSLVHRQRTILEAGHIDRILDDAGLLCAVLLLSGNLAIRVTGNAQSGDVDLPSLPGDLQFANAADALKSKVFTIEGGRAMPRHRTIAEFLAARAISHRIEKSGLPLGRVLAVLQGFDGKPVEALRGLFAWLAVHLQSADREHVLRMDPLGFILNGDAAALSRSERVLMLESLSASATDNQWFRAGHWVDHPFGPLATIDMADEYQARLALPERDRAHQIFVDCLLDALRYARDSMPSLTPWLASWVVDPAAFEGVRLAAYEAWKRHCPSEQQAVQMVDWLENLFVESIHDPDDRLLGRILRDVYPTVVQAEVLRYLRPKKKRRLIAEFSEFWGHYLIRQTPVKGLSALADAWIVRFPDGLPHEWKLDAQRTADQLLIATIESEGDHAPVEKLYAWLGIGLDDHESDRSDAEYRKRLNGWLEARPELVRAVTAYGYAAQRPDRHGHKNFWRVEVRLRGAARTHDLLRWNMALASTSEDEDFVRWIVHRIATAVLDPPLDIDVPDTEEIAAWVEALAQRFSSAPDWLQQAWTLPLDDWRAENFRRQARHQAEHEHARTQRKSRFAPVLAKLGQEPLPPGVLSQIAGAYDKHFYDIEGETAEARVEDLLGISGETVSAVLASLDATLDRDDLPSVDEILDLNARRRQHVIRSAVLLAAERVTQHDSRVWESWSDQLISKLVAFWLTEGLGEEPAWYGSVATYRPELVAPIFVRYASAMLRRKGLQAITGMWGLARHAGLQRLAELSLPELLESFPVRASEAARNELNSSLLAGLPRLDATKAVAIVRSKLQLPNLDPGQRIAWLVALLPFDASAAVALATLVGRNSRRATILGKALRDQGTLARTAQPMEPSAVQCLVQMLAPVTPYEPDWEGGFVSESREREETVKGLLENLGRNSTLEARQVLETLVSSEAMGKWKEIAEFQLQAQRSVYREAMFKAAGPNDVALLLANSTPANTGDLAALVIDHLRALEAHLRGDPSFQLRQFWKQPEHKPEPEEWCRDVLVNQLLQKLVAQKVDIQPESLAAANKRMDARVTAMVESGARLSIPIEIKKDNHRAVWTAWREQLDRLYAIDPAAEGFGIYLVLWFNYESTPSPEGFRPRSAAEFADQIRSRMPEFDRRRLFVYVMDLSWPPQAKR